MFMIGFHLDTYKTISFKLGMMIDMTIPLHADTSLNDLDFTQGHKVMRKLELVQPFCCKVA